ncbi:hypothetical protein DMN91_003977 [Ooceraea biroi]|uniref:SKA complex subunit 1 n=1 Tax=Ooceraea biroi TaxID=2015173 RepID=A0A026X0F9_OOCBI|nr:spindle and kinetochore-associated protein 1 [Ooceraea biroi]XP_011347539.1 spindle and kinetochore-associated protein 1 [Ooceraea biroi]XP_011347549.1 spindle and kinetochore-associated protein 1 [Ooceraea biroi]EZA61563.1 Spindle and kinetochore-associated protein [Ooceraea biroi]RLU23769.1 hypothetical protein DMN91_003977 [Ooceraea biroi]
MDKQGNLDDKQNNRDNFEQIIDRQLTKLCQLDGATRLIKSKASVKDELQRMHNEVLEVSVGVQNLRQMLEKLKEQNVRCRELSSLIDVLNKRILHQTENVPEEVIQSFQNVNKQICAQAIVSPNILDYTTNSSQSVTRTAQKTPGSVYRNTEKRETLKDCKRTLFNEPDNQICHTVPLITVEEFNKLPKYIIGRQTLDTINSLISAINQTLIAKYTILSLGKAAAQKKGEINLYLQYKKQELDVQEKNEYLYFFTAEDYYEQTKTKLDKTKLNLITALRHCKRLREYRIKNVLNYVIVPH